MDALFSSPSVENPAAWQHSQQPFFCDAVPEDSLDAPCSCVEHSATDNKAVWPSLLDSKQVTCVWALAACIAVTATAAASMSASTHATSSALQYDHSVVRTRAWGAFCEPVPARVVCVRQAAHSCAGFWHQPEARPSHCRCGQISSQQRHVC